MKTLMVQGTGSGVGKTTLVAALCRLFRRRGLRVAPFKAQNMSNNAHVCRDGGEIGRSTALHALACGIEPTVEMNPVLLKPATDVDAQVILMGRPVRAMSAVEYQREKPRLLGVIRECLDTLRRSYDLVILEGAGSPAEVNLREGDLVNMAAAELADAPVLLAGDIDVGGVFAQLVGTLHLLLPKERERVKGFLINKFRGDLSILKPGLDFLERETSRPVLGVVPWYRGIHLPEEDALSGRERKNGGERLRIDVLLQPRMANFTDFDALEAEPDVELRYRETPDGTTPDAYVLPGTKSTIADLRRLKEAGWAEPLRNALSLGGTVVGLCGGYQMLGRHVADPEGVESATRGEDGLGLLPVTTTFSAGKVTARVRGVHLDTGAEIEGYEIHMGRTVSDGEPALRISERGGVSCADFDGARAFGGRAWGTYVHGLFDRPGFRRAFLNRLRAARGWRPLETSAAWDPDRELDRLADHVGAHVDLDRITSL
ncbi:MAG TPA: cobyric acid synthase [Planctomycetota bacterium]